MNLIGHLVIRLVIWSYHFLNHERLHRIQFKQCWSTRVQYSYSSTTRVPFFEYSYSYSEPQVLGWYSYSKVNVLGTRSKKEPSTRVHLVFAKSNKQNEFLIVNCSQ